MPFLNFHVHSIPFHLHSVSNTPPAPNFTPPDSYVELSLGFHLHQVHRDHSAKKPPVTSSSKNKWSCHLLATPSTSLNFQSTQLPSSCPLVSPPSSIRPHLPSSGRLKLPRWTPMSFSPPLPSVTLFSPFNLFHNPLQCGAHPFISSASGRSVSSTAPICSSLSGVPHPCESQDCPTACNSQVVLIYPPLLPTTFSRIPDCNDSAKGELRPLDFFSFLLTAPQFIAFLTFVCIHIAREPR